MEKIKLRLYQEKILGTCVDKNTLVVLPTGLGKTFLALALAKHRLEKHEKSKVLFMAPTKPLANQHLNTFKKFLDKKMVCLTGSIAPIERKDLWDDSEIIFATPQTVENDLLGGRIRFDSVSLLVVDEAHRAVGDYSYVFLAEQYVKQAKNQRILALTASPGSNKEKIDEICEALNISRIEIRTVKDQDVISYVKEKAVNYVTVELPDPYVKIKESMNKTLQKILTQLKEDNFIKKDTIGAYSKKRFLILQRQMMKTLSRRPNQKYFKGVFLLSTVIKLLHAIEIMETQGLASLLNYYRKLKSQKSKSAKRIVDDPDFIAAIKALHEAHESGVTHPKYNKLVELLNKEKRLVGNFKAIVFTNYRYTASKVKDLLSKAGFKPVEFVGQSRGLTQKKQLDVLNKFRGGEYDVLVATSIGEEGLHIENADIGVFFEPVPSALRTIQRRGRIGRTNFGVIHVMMTRGAVDEKYHWIARHKEKNMYGILDVMKQEMRLREQKKLKDF